MVVHGLLGEVAADNNDHGAVSNIAVNQKDTILNQ